MSNLKGVFSHNSDEWSTPNDLFNQLDEEFHFTLDPCCNHENAKCKKYYTIEDDGLAFSWGGNECSVIHLTQTSVNGWKNVIERVRQTTRLWSC